MGESSPCARLVFGYNCDYSAFFPLRGASTGEGLVAVNHEYLIPLFNSDWRTAQDPTWDPRGAHRTLMEAEKKEVGVSVVHVRRDRAAPGRSSRAPPTTGGSTATGR